MQSHPLDGDGINPELFKTLARINRVSTIDNGLTFMVPDTILYYGCASFWYYYDPSTKTVQKHPAKTLEKTTIFENFSRTKKTARSGIVALFATWRTTKLEVRYFTKEELRHFLFQENRKDLFGILQKFVEPKSERADMLQVIWSPTLAFAVKRVNTAKIYDRAEPTNVRCCTFDGASHQCEEFFCNQHTTQLLADHCRCFVKLFGALEPTHSLGRMVSYLRQDTDDNFWLCFTTSVRVVEKQKGDALEVKSNTMSGRSKAPLVNPLMIFSSDKTDDDTFMKKKKKLICPPPRRLLSPFFTPAALEQEEDVVSYAKAVESRIRRREQDRLKIQAENDELSRDLVRLQQEGRQLCTSADTSRVSSRLSAADVKLHLDDEESDVSPSPAGAGSRSPVPEGHDLSPQEATLLQSQVSFASPMGNRNTPSALSPQLLDRQTSSSYTHMMSARRSVSMRHVADVSSPSPSKTARSTRKGKSRRKARVDTPDVFIVTETMKNAADAQITSCKQYADAHNAEVMLHASKISDVFYPILEQVESISKMNRLKRLKPRADATDVMQLDTVELETRSYSLMRQCVGELESHMKLGCLSSMWPPEPTQRFEFNDIPIVGSLRVAPGRMQQSAADESKMWKLRGQKRSEAIKSQELHKLLQNIQSRRQEYDELVMMESIQSSPVTESNDEDSEVDGVQRPTTDARQSLLDEIRQGIKLRSVPQDDGHASPGTKTSSRRGVSFRDEKGRRTPSPIPQQTPQQQRKRTHGSQSGTSPRNSPVDLQSSGSNTMLSPSPKQPPLLPPAPSKQEAGPQQRPQRPSPGSTVDATTESGQETEPSPANEVPMISETAAFSGSVRRESEPKVAIEEPTPTTKDYESHCDVSEEVFNKAASATSPPTPEERMMASVEDDDATPLSVTPPAETVPPAAELPPVNNITHEEGPVTPRDSSADLPPPETSKERANSVTSSSVPDPLCATNPQMDIAEALGVDQPVAGSVQEDPAQEAPKGADDDELPPWLQ